MILYHTSDREIRRPDIRYGRKNADFGWGFYLTPDREWFEYIFHNRRLTDRLSADVVVGPIANDTIFDTLGVITSGFLQPEEGLRLLMIGPAYTQVAVKSEKAVSQLRWIGTERIERPDAQTLEAEQAAYQEEFAKELGQLMSLSGQEM